MNETLPEFDDPQLKETLRRAVGGTYAAEPGLRARVEALVARRPAADAPAADAPAAARGWRPPVRWAAAAVLTIGALTATTRLWQNHRHQKEHEEYFAANLPLLNAMTLAEESGTAGGTDQSALPVASREALRAELTSRLGRTVPVPDWRDKGWTLAAATVAPIGAHPAAQLRYENAGRRVLFVSLPANAYASDGDEERYEYVVNNHAIVGFVKDGGLHCTVGDRTVGGRELAGLKVN
jgi:hypothetical protein